MTDNTTARARRKRREQAVSFERLLAQCRYAFQHRYTDARERTETLRDKYLDQATNKRLDAGRRSVAAHRQDKLSRLLYEFRHANLINEDGPTPEAALKPSKPGALARLYEAGRLDKSCLLAAVEIAKVYEAVSGFMWSRSRSFDAIRGGGGAGKYGVDKMPDWLADLHGSTYSPWARDMGERSDILFPMIIDVVVFDVALDLARRDHGIGYETALTMLRCALEDYALRMLVRRGVAAQ